MNIYKTEDQFNLLILRIVLAVVLLMHGLQQTIGWFHGSTLMVTMQTYQQAFGIPTWMSFIGIMSISLGSVLMILGLGTRIIAFLNFIFLAVACYKVHLFSGHFFMDWHGAQGGEGYEYHLLGLAIALVLTLGGSGKWSIDRLIAKQLI